METFFARSTGGHQIYHHGALPHGVGEKIFKGDLKKHWSKRLSGRRVSAPGTQMAKVGSEHKYHSRSESVGVAHTSM